MAAPFLVIVVVAMSILLMVAAVFLVIYFGHPDDRNEAKVPKAIVLFGLWLAFSSVLILPYDVANSRGAGGGMRVDILWQITYISTACMVSAVIPFAFFFYEADDEAEEGEANPQFGSAVKGTLLMAGFFFVLCGILFSVIGTAQIPVTRIAQGGGTITAIESVQFPTTSCVTESGKCSTDRFIWEIDVTFPIYIMALLSFIGWFFFTLFVGVGFVALPMDLINDYRTRPVPMDPATYVTTKKELGQRASALLDAGVALQSESRNINAGSKVSGSEKRRHAQALRSFEASYYLLKRDIEVLKVSYELKGGNPLFYYLEGFFGIIGMGLTLTWFIHIVVFILPPRPVTPFLNTMFIALEQNVGGFTLFGVVAYAIWSCYLLWCCVKGCFKFGMRLLFIKVYPMELGNTMLNAFLANTWILLLCCVPIIQFCVVSFPYYSRETQIDLLFGTQIKYLKFFRYFYQNSVFIYIIVILMGLTAFYLAVRPRDVSAEIDNKINAVAAKHTRGRD